MFSLKHKKLIFKFIKVMLIMFLSSNLIAKQLAVTFDDLPYNVDINVSELTANTSKILDALAKHNIQIIGFVNEEKLYSDNTKQRIEILEQWLKFGHDLGNHTYSHADFHKLNLSAFKEEVIKGEFITRKLMDKYNKKLKYFRYPYSHAGLNADVRSEFVEFLDHHGYRIAPLTIDTDDWVLDEHYVTALETEDEAKVKAIEKEYLAHTRAKFAFYDKVTKDMFDRDISHVWILHANTINTKLINELLNIAMQYGYTFVTLDKALEDVAYKNLDIYFGQHGPSWLYRWDYSNGLKIDWRNDPDPKI